MASEKGVVVGRLTFTEDGDAIDCSKMGVGGKAIPPNIDKVCHSLQLLCTSCGPELSRNFSRGFYRRWRTS